MKAKGHGFARHALASSAVKRFLKPGAFFVRGCRRLLLWLAFLVVSVPPLPGQMQPGGRTQALDAILESLRAVREFSQVAISPDGTQVSWVENQGSRGGRGTAIQIADVNSPGQPRRITAATDTPAYETQAVWSPDGKQIAFLSDAASAGQLQLYVTDLGSGRTRPLTDLTGSLSSPSWSPDAKEIAFLFIENSPRAAGPQQPMIPPAGLIEEQVYEQRLVLISPARGGMRTVSPADLYVYEYDWMPDGSGFVATAAPGDGDKNWWLAGLYAIPARPEGPARLLYKPQFQISTPRVSPDGRAVAFIHGLMSDQGVTGGDIWLGLLDAIWADGSSFGPRNLTPNLPASATWLAWSGTDRLLFTELADGNTAVATLHTNGKVQTLWSGAELISAGNWEVSLSAAREGKQTAIVRSSALRPPEVWVGPVGAWEPFTAANRGVKPFWGDRRSLHWNNGKVSVQGWLLLPRGYEVKTATGDLKANTNPAEKLYPLIVHVHGGPAAACSTGWPNWDAAVLAATGYFVFCPNPRGSFGQGESFTQANLKDFGGGDFRDVMTGIDEVLRQFPIDPQRLGISGWSYGGFMTMWAESQTSRFRAAVAGAGVSNWLSYYGENDIDQWMIPYFGASVYDDPPVYARSSPINFAKAVKTPTLILVGDRDGECPAPQSYEWWHALKVLHVPVQLVVYPGEGHSIRQPDHQRDIIVRTVEWFDQWLRHPHRP
jgi:dipeptidyl aminopeptidase/acylaminoacyl peptidase